MKAFLGSSTERLDDLRRVASWIEEAGLTPVPWDEPGLFPLGSNTWLRLIEISKEVDAAVFIFSDDDKIWYRSDAAFQPRDNVMIEYGLFAGALGPRRAIICKYGETKPATDLRGLQVADISPSKVSRGRLQVMHWAQNLGTIKEDPAISELVFQRDQLRQELVAVRDELAFEKDKSKDLQTLVTQSGTVDFSTYDIKSDAHWKLLFERQYFSAVIGALVGNFDTPAAWHEELKRCELETVASRINWDHERDQDRMRFYVSKSLRLFRSFENPRQYLKFLRRTSKPVQDVLDAQARQAIAGFNLTNKREDGGLK